MPGPVDYSHANAEYLPAGFKWSQMFRRVYLGAYYEPFRERVIVAKTRAAERGAFYWSQYGYRPWVLQHKLRLAWLNGTGGKAAPAGLSAHQYGLADDSVADGMPETPDTLEPTWEAKRYDILGEECERVGLVWGASFQDRPHIQWPGYVNAEQLRPLQIYWQKLGESTDELKLRAVWSYLDTLPALSLPPLSSVK